jgi:hypothetical protein
VKSETDFFHALIEEIKVLKTRPEISLSEIPAQSPPTSLYLLRNLMTMTILLLVDLYCFMIQMVKKPGKEIFVA